MHTKTKGHLSRIVITGEMAFVELSQGFWATVDIDDVPLVGGQPWHAVTKPGKPTYANSGRVGLMHRFLLEAPREKMVDHKNGWGLDNRRHNIRLCTYQQNSANTGVLKTSSLGIRGVRITNEGRYRAEIMVNKRHINLGTYIDIGDAIKAYREGQLSFFGDFARTK